MYIFSNKEYFSKAGKKMNKKKKLLAQIGIIILIVAVVVTYSITFIGYFK